MGASGVGGAVVGILLGSTVYSAPKVHARWHRRSEPQVAAVLQQSESYMQPYLTPPYGPLLVAKHPSSTST